MFNEFKKAFGSALGAYAACAIVCAGAVYVINKFSKKEDKDETE